MKNSKPQITGLKVVITDDTDKGITRALRQFKRKVIADNKLREYQDRQEFTKPSERKKRAHAAAKKRHQRAIEKKQPPPRNY